MSNASVYDSRFLTPYIVYLRTFSVAVPADGFVRTNFAHGLPFLPLLIGQWSNNPNFEPSYDLSMQTPVFHGTRPKRVCQVGSDAERIYFDLAENASEDCVFYFRLMALAPPDFAGDISSFFADKTDFNFDSRMNYPKIVDFRKVGASGSFSHGLRFVPQVNFWSKVQFPIDANYTLRPAFIPSFSAKYGNTLNGVALTSAAVKYNFTGSDKNYILVFGDGF